MGGGGCSSVNPQGEAKGAPFVHSSLAEKVYAVSWHATSSIGALTIRIGLWGPLYYKYDKELPK